MSDEEAARGMIGGLITNETFETFERRGGPFERNQQRLQAVQEELEADRLSNLIVPDALPAENRLRDFIHPFKLQETVVKLGVDAFQISVHGVNSIINKTRK